MTDEKFDKFNLKKTLLSGIFAHGFEHPSSIQCLAIPKILDGNDIIVQAQSGTGKTATFTISLLQKLDETKKVPQILILSPTRELAQQTFGVIKSISQKMEVSTVVLYGGQSVEEDRKKCKENPQVVVGCPGRVQQMIKEGYLDTRQMIMHIIDEADEMFERNFAESMTYIMEHIPETAQMVLVSATMPKEVVQLTQQFMPKAEKILVNDEELRLDGIRQYKIDVEESWKEKTLNDILKVLSVQQCVIFVNKIQRAENLRDEMRKLGFQVESITSAMEQVGRNEIMKKFKNGEFRYLIGTDIIARGIDVQSVTCVVNFDMPRSTETYLHRIGRSGRFGRKGIAINFLTPRNKDIVKEIEEKYQVKLEELPADLTKLV